MSIGSPENPDRWTGRTPGIGSSQQFLRGGMLPFSKRLKGQNRCSDPGLSAPSLMAAKIGMGGWYGYLDRTDSGPPWWKRVLPGG